jgi:hypothetical protein
VILADTPNFASNPAICLSAHLQDTSECGEARSVAIDSQILEVEKQIAAQSNARFISLTDFTCSTDRCDPIIGDTLVYRDSNHLSATFSNVLAPVLAHLLLLDCLPSTASK